VRKEHQRRRRLLDHRPQCDDVPVGRVLFERGRIDGQDLAHCGRRELLRRGAETRTQHATAIGPPACWPAAIASSSRDSTALSLLRDNEDHQITLASSRRRLTGYAASAERTGNHLRLLGLLGNVYAKDPLGPGRTAAGATFRISFFFAASDAFERRVAKLIDPALNRQKRRSGMVSH
jgi:hypothetical protein